MLGLVQEEVGLKRLAVESFKTYLNFDGYTNPECDEYAKRRVNDSHAAKLW